MKPPEATQDTPEGVGDLPPSVSVCADVTVTTLKKRSDFLAANHGARWGTKGFLLQGRNRDDECGDIRVGFTCSKKVGNAVARNRAKRRLREVARLGLPELGRSGWDYVLIGKSEKTAALEFTKLQSDLEYALRKLHKKSDEALSGAE